MACFSDHSPSRGCTNPFSVCTAALFLTLTKQYPHRFRSRERTPKTRAQNLGGFADLPIGHPAQIQGADRLGRHRPAGEDAGLR